MSWGSAMAAHICFLLVPWYSQSFCFLLLQGLIWGKLQRSVRNTEHVFHGHPGPAFFLSNYFGRGAAGCCSPCPLQINTVPGLLEDLQ